MKGGTSNNKEYYPIHAIANKLFPIFHALTGSDTTSYIAGHTKKTAFNVYKEHDQSLDGLNQKDLSDTNKMEAEQFLCFIYNLPNTVITSDQARCV